MTDHLKFCNVCINKNWTSKSGVLCGITNNKPNFTANCKDYAYSKKKYQEMIAEKQKSYERLTNRQHLDEKSDVIINPTIKIENHRIHSTHGLDDKYEVFFPFPLKLIFRKPTLIIDNLGIHPKGKTIKWNEIIYTSFQTEWEGDTKGNQSKATYLVIDAISKNLTTKIPISLFDKKNEIGHYIELYKEKNIVG